MAHDVQVSTQRNPKRTINDVEVGEYFIVEDENSSQFGETFVSIYVDKPATFRFVKLSDPHDVWSDALNTRRQCPNWNIRILNSGEKVTVTIK